MRTATRRARKGDFRRLWIQRINAAARENGTSYSRFVSGLKQKGSRSIERFSRISQSWIPMRSAIWFSSQRLTTPATAVTLNSKKRPREGRFQRQPERTAGASPDVRLGLRHQRVQRLRRLLQRRSARLTDGVFVTEGVKLLDCALDARGGRIGLRRCGRSRSRRECESVDRALTRAPVDSSWARVFERVA